MNKITAVVGSWWSSGLRHSQSDWEVRGSYPVQGIIYWNGDRSLSTLFLDEPQADTGRTYFSNTFYTPNITKVGFLILY